MSTCIRCFYYKQINPFLRNNLTCNISFFLKPTINHNKFKNSVLFYSSKSRSQPSDDNSNAKNGIRTGTSPSSNPDRESHLNLNLNLNSNSNSKLHINKNKNSLKNNDGLYGVLPDLGGLEDKELPSPTLSEMKEFSHRKKNSSSGIKDVFKSFLTPMDSSSSRKFSFNSNEHSKMSNNSNNSLLLSSGKDEKSTGNHLSPANAGILERSLLHKPLGDMLVRCTVFDSDGHVSVVSGEFKKAELLSEHGLLHRDLRKIDTGIRQIIPSILVRKNSILINLLHIRALIKSDLVIVFDDNYGPTDSHTQSVFMYDLEGKLQAGPKAMGGLPYEFRALEAIFISVVSALDADMKVHTAIVQNILADLEDDIDRNKLRHLLIQSKKLTAFFQRATLIRDTIEEVLESDEDLAGMYLTDKANGKPHLLDDHSEIELMLETYYKYVDEIVQQVGSLISDIKFTEEIANIILDANRNSLMILEIKYTIATVGLGVGTFFAGLFGMNLKTSIEESDYGFLSISAAAVVLTIWAVLRSLRVLRSVQRAHMSLEPFTSSHPSANNSLRKKLNVNIPDKLCESNNHQLQHQNPSILEWFKRHFSFKIRSNNKQHLAENYTNKVNAATNEAFRGYGLKLGPEHNYPASSSTISNNINSNSNPNSRIFAQDSSISSESSADISETNHPWYLNDDSFGDSMKHKKYSLLRHLRNMFSFSHNDDLNNHPLHNSYNSHILGGVHDNKDKFIHHDANGIHSQNGYERYNNHPDEKNLTQEELLRRAFARRRTAHLVMKPQRDASWKGALMGFLKRNKYHHDSADQIEQRRKLAWKWMASHGEYYLKNRSQFLKHEKSKNMTSNNNSSFSSHILNSSKKSNSSSTNDK